MAEYRLVETKQGDSRVEYILMNNKPLNIYGAKKILEAQQFENEALKAQAVESNKIINYMLGNIHHV